MSKDRQGWIVASLGVDSLESYWDLKLPCLAAVNPTAKEDIQSSCIDTVYHICTRL